MRLHAPVEWRSYVAVFCGVSALVVGAITTLNYRVDPYLIHQWNTPKIQQLRPEREQLSPWGKTYAVAMFRPSVLYAGNSRTELGLPVDTELFAGRNVFNGALSGASLADAISMVRHASEVGRLDTVVWGIDAPSFSVEPGNTDFVDELVASDRFYLWRREFINIKRALAMDMTKDSVSLLRGSFGQLCRSNLAFHGQRDETCMRGRLAGHGGTAGAIVPRTREYLRGSGPQPQALRAMGSSVARLCSAGTRVRLYINPTHAMTADAMYWAGKWQAMEAWQADLTNIGERYRQSGCDVRIHDFSGFNSITSETIPQVSGIPEMAYYWETSHYRATVGRLILARIFGKADGVPDDFGTELRPAMLSDYQAEQRTKRSQYHMKHPEETSMVFDIVFGIGVRP